VSIGSPKSSKSSNGFFELFLEEGVVGLGGGGGGA